MPSPSRRRDLSPLRNPEACVSEAHLRILQIVRRIPFGRVCTYGRIAEAAGLPGRSRLVGRVLRNSPLADSTPWHRVVNASGRVSLRDGDGPELQVERLCAEGIELVGGSRLDLATYLWLPSQQTISRRKGV